MPNPRSTTADPRPALEFRDIRFAYPDGTVALDGVSLSIPARERVALLGPNGAGKSTLMLHANGLLRPESGAVRVEGLGIADETLHDIRQTIGLVFQDPDDQLFMTTLYDDVAFGPLNMDLPAPQVDERVHQALHAVGLENSTSRPGQHLSFGQKKRAALATVLSMGAKILVLDEPTSNLDPRARRDMIGLLASLDSTLLVATHDMDLAWRLCSRAVIMDGGLVVADGPSGQVLADQALLESHGLELPPSVAARVRDGAQS